VVTCVEVSQSLVLSLGLTEKQLSIWTEMEMSAFSVLLHCRRCGRRVHSPNCCAKGRNRCDRSMFVARDEYEEATLISCPLPGCKHVWCRKCDRSVESRGPKHSCDGTAELDHLMKEKGWKYCPSESTRARYHLLSDIF
jgi:hypothetical protein